MSARPGSDGDIVLAARDAGADHCWSALAAARSEARLTTEDAAPASALRFDFSLEGHGAFAIARREIHAALPAHYVASLRLRGEAGPVQLQLKLVDPDGTNVWWWREDDFVPVRDSRQKIFRRAALQFAWGPRSGGDPSAIGAVEIAVASDRGARGTLWIEDLRIEPRDADARAPRAISARASSFASGHEPAHVLDADARTRWRPDATDESPWLELDLGARHEWGGLVVEFSGTAGSPACRVFGSEDREHWSTLCDIAGDTDAGRWLRTGDAESRFVRLAFPHALRDGISHVTVVPLELAVSPQRFAAAAARSAPRGQYPRHLLGEHAYWAVVGVEGDERRGLLGEDGAVEVDAEGFTLEPFLRSEGRIVSWADVEAQPSLHDRSLPIPSVTWDGSGLRLDVTALATGEPGRSAIVTHYRVENRADRARAIELLVAIRPFQVTPEWQRLNLVPAISPITRLRRDGARVRVNHTRSLTAITAPHAICAAGSAAGSDPFFEHRLPELVQVDDPLGFAQGVIVFALQLDPGASAEAVLAWPLHDATPALPDALSPQAAAAWWQRCLAETSAHWRARLAQIPISLPACAAAIEESLRASLGWVLACREGPRIQAGPRCYRRSWIRDGSLGATALAELGFADEGKEFVRWYAGFQLPDGRVPCAVDRRGVDAAVEHDSHGQLAFAAVELWRLTGDLGFLRELWPNVRRAADAIATLRSERTSPGFAGDARFGLLPESISHEGYASSPVHSFWDDFFALRGLADAAAAASALGDAAASERFAALRAEMQRDVRAALVATVARDGIDFVPGSVELGDFDPSSTAIVFDPCDEAALIPGALLVQTFERYWRELEARWRGERPLDAYTAYEVRNAVALLRLGWKERALALLSWLVADQRPPGWRQWPEVSTHDPRSPRFLGDLPHGWVATSFVRCVRRLVADEQRDAGVLVVAAGIPEAWVREPPGVRARGLPTSFGKLDLDLVADREDRVIATFGGTCRPPSGIVLVSPFDRPLREIRIDGKTLPALHPRRVTLSNVAREIVLQF